MAKFKPKPHQEIAIAHAIKNPYAGLFLQMGLGKTVCTLTAIDFILNDLLESHKILVIAPKLVAEDTWPTEIKKWPHLSHLTYSIVLGPEKRRIEALNATADIYIINRENVPWLVSQYGRKWPFTFVVIDELSSFKSQSAQRFKALRKVRPLMQRVIGLTGTPAPNGLLDLWPQVYLLDRGERLGKAFTHYRDDFFMAGRKGKNAVGAVTVFDYILKPDADLVIYERIGDICMSMKTVDWLDMPPHVAIETRVKLDKKAAALYKEMEKEYIITVDDTDVEAVSAAVLSNKLLQMANGAVYDDNRGVVHIHDAKLDALEELIEESVGNPVLVAYMYEHDKTRLLERFKTAVVYEGTHHREAWERGEIPILLLHPQSGGHGLNLQYGGHIVIWFGLTWSLEYYQQLIARLDRQGQQSRVSVYHIITEGTVDEEVLKALQRKDATQDGVMEAIKAKILEIKKDLK